MVSFKRHRTLAMVLLAQLGALMFALKMVMAGLPNIEPVSVLILVYTLCLGSWALVPIYLYVFLEYAVWGFSVWSVCYLYVWAVLFLAAWLLRRMQSRVGWALVSAVYGLLFGALCAVVYIFIGGVPYAVSWWLSGIPFDLAHCAGNFALTLVLLPPLRKLLDRLLLRADLKMPEAPAADK